MIEIEDECKEERAIIGANYCPNCGTKMEEGKL